MQTSQTPVWARDHTILGVCEALGEDLGFNPLFLRVPLACLLVLNPFWVLGIYAALALVVAFTRLVSPNPRPAAADAGSKGGEAAADQAEPDMALAA